MKTKTHTATHALVLRQHPDVRMRMSKVHKLDATDPEDHHQLVQMLWSETNDRVKQFILKKQGLNADLILGACQEIACAETSSDTTVHVALQKILEASHIQSRFNALAFIACNASRRKTAQMVNALLLPYGKVVLGIPFWEPHAKAFATYMKVRKARMQKWRT